MIPDCPINTLSSSILELSSNVPQAPQATRHSLFIRFPQNQQIAKYLCVV